MYNKNRQCTNNPNIFVYHEICDIMFVLVRWKSRETRKTVSSIKRIAKICI